MLRAKILVVDDSGPFRRFVCQTLHQKGVFDVMEASDGWEAVQKAEEFQPDLILLDIGLPKLNGLEAGRRIQTLCPESRIVFLSQESSPDVVAAALGLRSRGFIHKLRAQTYLLLAIDAILKGKQTPLRHEVHFYPDDVVLLERLDRFIAPALMANNAALVIATKPHREALAQRLRNAGVDVEGATQKGTYISLDAADLLSTIMVNGRPDRDLFLEGLRSLVDSAARATTLDHPRVAIFGECVALLLAQGNVDAAVTLEQTGNEFLQEHRTSRPDILCAYPLLPFSNEPAFQSICTEHHAVSVQ